MAEEVNDFPEHTKKVGPRRDRMSKKPYKGKFLPLFDGKIWKVTPEEFGHYNTKNLSRNIRQVHYVSSMEGTLKLIRAGEFLYVQAINNS